MSAAVAKRRKGHSKITADRGLGAEYSWIAEPLRSLAVPIESLHPDPANARVHNEKQMAVLRDSLRRYGQRLPLVVQREGMIVRVGNARLEVAKAMGWSHVVALVLDDPDHEAAAFGLMENRSHDLSTFDDAKLAELIDSLKPDLRPFLGFGDRSIDGLIASLRGKDVHEDGLPSEVPQRCAVGDLWLLGEHRLLCGDATKGEDVARLLDGRVPFIMVTDPPYGVNYDPAWRRGIRGTFADVKQDGLVTNDARADWTEVWQLSPTIVAYVWHSALHSSTVARSLDDAKYEIRAQIIWRKQMAPMTRGHYRWQHEPCWYAAGGSSKWVGDINESTIWDIKNLSSVGGGGNEDGDEKQGHGTQKPVECMARPIRNHGGPDDDVYDPFVGSGTTIIAAEQLERRCYAIEIEPKYCDVCIARWEKLTGKKAQLAERSA